jgi:hypothetical protein
MKKLGVVLVAIVTLISCFATLDLTAASTSENSWIEKTPMPTARGYLQAAVLNDKIYAIGGSGPVGTNEEYNPTTNSWTTKAPMPNPTQSFTIAICQGKIYCLGGISQDPTGMNKVYDPSTDSWENKASMPVGGSGLMANVVNGKIYCLGAVELLEQNQEVERLNIIEVYDPANDLWTTKTTTFNVTGCISAVVDDKIYIIGLGKTLIYNPASDAWGTAMPSPANITSGGANGVAATAIATLGIVAPKRIYVYDGASLQVYNPEQNSWIFGSAPPISRQYLGTANLNDTLYFIGGITNDPSGLPWYVKPLNTNEQYIPIGYGNLPETTPSQKAVNPTTIALTATLTVAIVVASGLLIYFKKFRHFNKLGKNKFL